MPLRLLLAKPIGAKEVVQLEDIYEDENLKISAVMREGDRCILTFTGVGMNHGGVDVQSEEFKKIDKSAGSQFFIIDKNRSWGNMIDFDLIKEKLDPHIQGKRCSSLGLSMGGFLAIVATKYFNIDCCVAFCPQWSVHPDVPPNEFRWVAYTSRVKDWKVRSLDGYFNDTCIYNTFFSGIEEELAHLLQFPKAPNIHHYIVGFNRHNVGRGLAESNLLYPILEVCLEGKGPEDLPVKTLEEDGYHLIMPEG